VFTIMLGTSAGNNPEEAMELASELRTPGLTSTAAGMEWPSGTEVGLSEFLPLVFGSLILWSALGRKRWGSA